MKEKTKIYLIDDHRVVRDGLAALINDLDAFEAISGASNGKQAIAAFNGGLEADIVLLDLKMPEMDGYDTAEWLAQNRPEVKILVMTMGVESGLSRLIASRICGIINKEISKTELLNALLAVRDGRKCFTEEMQQEIRALRDEPEMAVSKKEEIAFSPTEREFIKLCTTELTYQQIGDKMKLTHYATEALRAKVFDKLKVNNRNSAVVYAVRSGIADGN